MVNRQFWIRQIETAWKNPRSIVWLSGVRRVGKTSLCQSLEDIEYFDCELPRVRRQIEDPESFLRSLEGKRIVLDEIHRLGNPSELLKIAADHYPKIKIIATGSSTLQASKKFKDTLTGRKREIWLTPMINEDCQDFGEIELSRRLLHGGLPPFFLSNKPPERDFQEWMDSFWAKDIQELFRLERRWAFQKFLELLLAQSGGLFEATAFAAPCEISRSTVLNYLNALEATRACHVIRPFSTYHPTEIVASPRVFGFDTGFVAYYRGWLNLRPEDKGYLWEHYVLNEIQGLTQGSLDIKFWRDKQGHEVDFVLIKRGQPPVALECKWQSKSFNPRNMVVFRRKYPKGKNWVLSNDTDRPWSARTGGLLINYLGIQHIAKSLMQPSASFL